jgi:hypothetical protein
MTARYRYHRGLQVAADVYQDDTGRTITLEGVSHVADADFWLALSSRLAFAEGNNGAEIHFEGVGKDVENPPKLGLDYAAFAESLGLVAQKPGLTYRDTWKRTDIELSEILAHISPERLAKHEKTAAEAEHMLLHAAESRAFRRGLHWGLIIILAIYSGSRLRTSTFGVPASVILDRRNMLAACAAMNTDRDVVAVWGANHLPGIGKLLRRAGFRRVSRHWSTAITPPAKRGARSL